MHQIPPVAGDGVDELFLQRELAHVEVAFHLDQIDSFLSDVAQLLNEDEEFGVDLFEPYHGPFVEEVDLLQALPADGSLLEVPVVNDVAGNDGKVVPVAAFAVEEPRVVTLPRLQHAQLVHELNLALGTAVHLRTETDLGADAVLGSPSLRNDDVGAHSGDVFKAFRVDDEEAVMARVELLEDPNDVCAHIAENPLRWNLLDDLKIVPADRNVVVAALHVFP